MLVALLPLRGMALECSDYSIRASYWSFKALPDTYQLVLGEFSNLRKVVEQEAVVETGGGIKDGFEIWEGKIKGFTASRSAFDQPFEAIVTLEFPEEYLMGGSLPSSGELESLRDVTGLVWLKETEAGYSLTSGLCWPMIDPDPASVKKVLRCMNGGYCPKS